MVAALLGDGISTLYNVPPIGDTQITIDLLRSIGVTVTYTKDQAVMNIDPRTICSSSVPYPDSGSNRVPILLLGALLHHYSEVSIPILGGCKIGKRPVDFHISAIEKFGGKVLQTEKGFTALRDSQLMGTHIELPYPSVGATETCLYLAVLAKGRSVISNAAIEPEILELITMLRSLGAIIYSTSSREVIVDGVSSLRGTRISILGDRIEAASWACLACASNGDITVHGIRPDILGNFLSIFQSIGGGLEFVKTDSIRFFRRSLLRPAIIETDVYPGFSTDWQQPFAVLLTQAEGISIIHETVYEDRFGYLSALNALGAKTQLSTQCLGGAQCRYRNKDYAHSAIILGPTPFIAVDCIEIPDLRAGLAYIIASAIASGKTVVKGIDFLERGYGDILPRLASLNLQIELVEG